jgi:hypothetical protein
MNMKTQSEISLLADQELDPVIGGKMNIPRSDFHRQDSVPGSTGGVDPLTAGGIGLVIGVGIGIILA